MIQKFVAQLLASTQNAKTRGGRQKERKEKSGQNRQNRAQSLYGEPTPLPSCQPRDARFPIEFLSPRARKTAEAIQRVIQAPEALCAQAVLGAMSLSVSPIATVQSLVSNSDHSIALYLMTIAESGERKSAVDSQAMKGIYDLVWEHHENHAREMAAYKASRASGACEMADMAEPEFKSFLTNEPTYEGIAKMIASGAGFAGLFSDEAGQFFGGHAMNKENRMKTAGGLSKLWDLDMILRHRATPGLPTYIPPCPTTANLMIQPVIMGDTYADDFLVGQGLLARMLPAWPPSNIGKRPFREALPEDLKTIADFQELTRACLESAIAADTKLDLIELTGETREAAKLFHDEVESHLQDGGDYADIRGFGAKANEHSLRIAAVMSLFENPMARELQLEYLLGAQGMMKFYLKEFQHIRAGALADPKTMLAESLRVWLLENVQPGENFAKERIQQYGPSNLRRNSTLNDALRCLEEYGWIQQLPPDTKVDGKSRRQAYNLNLRSRKTKGAIHC